MTGTDRRWQMTTANRSQGRTGGDNTKYGALVARVSHLSQDRTDLKFASMQACCAMAKPSARDMERVERIGRYVAGKPRAKRWFRWHQSGTRRLVSAGVIMRGGHCLKVWTKKQTIGVSLSTAESELHAAVKTASEELRIQSVAKD